MGVDFNQAEEQGSGAGPIPEDSVVILHATIRQPSESEKGSTNDNFKQSKTSKYQYLDFEFLVMSKPFEGKKIWQNFMLFNPDSTDKAKQAISISMRTLRAIVEAHRRISPKDASPAATTARMINDWSDLNAMMFPAVVGVEWSRPNDSGKRYLNNTIKRIVTVDDDRFAKVFADPEWIINSGKPLPEEPTINPTTAAGKPAWAAPTVPATPAQATLPGTKAEGPAHNVSPKPPWAK